MAPNTALRAPRPTSPRGRAHDADRHVVMRMRERRIMLGLTQQQMAELIGVTYQQAHKYEKGTNRISAGRLFRIAQALDVEVGFFFDGMGTERVAEPNDRQRAMLDLARSFAHLPTRRHQQAICDLARALANPAGVPANDG
jgi:transcriptional regulator with XRE-family HTH domain